MINRGKKAVLAAKLSALSQALSNLKCKCQTVWFIVKQIWYIPFFWSLAWYSYWIFRSAIVFNTPLLQINATDYLGAIISIVALIIAGYRAKAPIKRSVEVANAIGINVKRAFSSKDHLKEGGQVPSLPRKPLPSTQAEIPRQLKPEVKHLSPVETRPSPQKETVIAKKPALSPSNISVFSGNVSRSSQDHASSDLSTECLTCAKLVNCTYRQKRAIELSQGENISPCRFNAELPSKNA